LATKLKWCVCAYVLGSLLLLCGFSFFLPADAVHDSGSIALVDGWATSLVVDAVLMSEGSSHPVALRITYLAMILLAVLGAFFLAIAMGRKAPPVTSFLPQNMKVSGGFLLLAALLLVSTPFLPLGDVRLPIVQSVQEGIKHARGSLAIWSCLFFIAQAAMWFFIFNYLFSKLKQA